MKKLTAIVLVLTILMSSLISLSTLAKNDAHWAQATIDTFIEAGYVDAGNKHIDKPDQHLTRDEVVALVETTVGFVQVDQTMLDGIDEVAWVMAVPEQGHKQVTREEVIVIVAALLGEPAIEGSGLSQKFVDLSDMSSWAAEALETVLAKGIFVGDGNKLRPLGKITFAEMITALDRVMDVEASKAAQFESLDFEDGMIPEFVTGGDAEILVVDNELTGSKGLQVDYAAADFPTVRFTAEVPWDMSGSKALSFQVTNPTDNNIKFYLRVDDDAAADGSTHSTVSIVDVKPNSTETFFLGLASEALDYGMRNLPITAAGKQLSYGWGETALNAGHIVEFQMWQMFISEANTLIFDNIQVINDPNSDLSSMDDIIDPYGQFTGMEWDGKVTSDQDLLDDKTEESSVIGSYEGLTTSTYGGWADGPQLEGTGYFRVIKYDGKWTLVDPEGYLFFSTGLDITRLDDGNTWVSGRENMFVDLPAMDGELGDHYNYTTYTARSPLGQTEGWLFNHYAANLERKYGSDYENTWRDISVDRFKDWGFSSIGNWSEPSLFHGQGSETELAYVANAWSHNGTHATIPSGNPFWGPVADPFDPEFVTTVETMVQDQILAYGVADDEWCLGIYIDNEQAWGDPTDTQRKFALIVQAMAMDAATETSYAKRALVDYLEGAYSEDITALNTAWGTSLTSFTELEAPFTPESVTEAMIPDYSAMLEMLADKYFSIVDAELEEKLPNHLYIGSRFAEWGTSLEVQRAAAKYVDVISFNVYKEDVVGEPWMELETLDMPVIIGEFHFGATDRGMFGGGLVNATDQENRGDKYIHYIDTVAQSDYFVGAHWFQYYDQPLLGRAWDGENYNVGFVDVTDQPYPHLVAAAQEVHSKVYDIKFNGLDINGGGPAAEPILISFEDAEDLSFISAAADTTAEYVEENATEGSRAMRVTLDIFNADYAGVTMTPSTAWNLGDDPSITFDVTNPGPLDIQIRSNVIDGDGQTRFYYFPVAAGETRSLVIDNFEASAAVWGADGFWGAENGLDTSNITMTNFYLWEEMENSGNVFFVDNYQVSQ